MVVGLKQSKKAVEAGNASLAHVAFDADSEVVEPFLTLCRQMNVTVERNCDMKELGKRCKVEVPTAVAVVTI